MYQKCNERKTQGGVRLRGMAEGRGDILSVNNLPHFPNPPRPDEREESETEPERFEKGLSQKKSYNIHLVTSV